MPILKGEKIVLRPFLKKDVNNLYEFKNDWEVIKTLGGLSHGYSLEALERWIENIEGKENDIVWAIADRNNDECIGHIGLYNINYRDGKANKGTIIGYKDYMGKGIASEANSLILDYAFLQLRLHRVEATVLEDNQAIIHVKEKLGYKKEGVLRDHQFRNGKYHNAIIMGIISNEWKSTKYI